METLKVKRGERVAVHIHDCSDSDFATLLVNNKVFEFPLPEPGTIEVTDELVPGEQNVLVMRIHNEGGGTFGEPSKWRGSFSIWAGNTSYGRYSLDGDDWGRRAVHEVKRVIILLER